LDIGGKKEKKRGMFDISKYPLQVSYANIDAETNPDYLCDASNIPVSDNSFDGVILAEVLEHIKDPKTVLAESFRTLKPGGKMLITVPFMFHVHGDPSDYGRYTQYYFQEILQEAGFKNIHIEKQGLFFSTLANMIKFWIEEVINKKRWKTFLKYFYFWFAKKSFKWDNSNFVKKSKVLCNYTTGYGIICTK
jgi:ubiquinone/menaquinone biosynthesis C-methylase UbiE